MAIEKHSTLVEDTADDYTSIETWYNLGIVAFDVGGRVFKIRRTVLDTFPDTMLARAASELWNTNMVSTLAANAATEESNNNKNNRILKPEPIFIDRDSDRFAFVLDFIRNNGIVELPVTISRDAFLRDLEYYGFDDTNINHTSITSTVPAYEALMKIDKLHTKFHDEMVQMKIEKDYKILAFACFCEYLQKYDLKCNITANPVLVTNPNRVYSTSLPATITEFKLPSSMEIMEKKLTEKFVLNGIELMEVTGTLSDTTEMIKYEKNMKLFKKFLSEYGFECESVTNVGEHSAIVSLKPID